VIDLAILDPLLMILGPQPTVFDQLGIIQERTGNRSVNNAPRNTYQTRDGAWVALSTSAPSAAKRVMELVGRRDLVEQPWFETGSGRAEHVDELDAAVSEWIAQRDRDEVLLSFAEADAAVAPIYDVAALMADAQVQARESIVEIHDDDLGPMKMQNVLYRLSETPGTIRWTGRSVGADNDEVFDELGVSPTELAELRRQGVV
jgi:crotonobetainyl-CoA:carnitine CoA-transferase CaiB-like acyl-CoA transferase